MARFIALFIVAAFTGGCSTFVENLRASRNSFQDSESNTADIQIPVEPLGANEPVRTALDPAANNSTAFSPDDLIVDSAMESPANTQQNLLTQLWDDSFSPTTPTTASNRLAPLPEPTAEPTPTKQFRLVPMRESSSLPSNSETAAGTAEKPSPTARVVQPEMRSSYTTLAAEDTHLANEESLPDEFAPGDASDDVPIRELDQLFAQLQSANTLRLERVSLCQRVDGFGQISEFADSTFLPGQSVLIYCEVANFKSVPDENAPETGHKASLSGGYIIIDRDGQIVAEREYSAADDRSSSVRDDFFLVFPAKIPETKPGWYRLYLVVYDEIAQEMVAQGNPIQFRIGEMASAAR